MWSFKHCRLIDYKDSKVKGIPGVYVKVWVPEDEIIRTFQAEDSYAKFGGFLGLLYVLKKDHIDMFMNLQEMENKPPVEVKEIKKEDYDKDKLSCSQKQRLSIAELFNAETGGDMDNRAEFEKFYKEEMENINNYLLKKIKNART